MSIFPEKGYLEDRKSPEYTTITNSVMKSIITNHFDKLVDIISELRLNYIYLADISNIGGAIRDASRLSPPPSRSSRTPSPRPESVEHGPTGFDIEKQIFKNEKIIISLY